MSTSGRFEAGSEGLRQRTARGTVVNAAFLAGLNALGLLKAFVVAGLLTTSEYGVWSIVLVGLGTLLGLKQIGAGERYVQQDDADQERAFQRAFGFELVVSGAMLAVCLVALPLLALAYDRSEILLPGLVFLLAVPAAALQSPTWVFYRRMDFVRQRTIQAVDPLVGFVATVALAIAGLGYWSLVIGLVIGAWAGAAVAIAACPFRLRPRIERRSLRDYLGFSWPLAIATASAVAMAQLAVFAGERELGLAGAAAIVLALSAAIFADRVDAIVTQTLYPAICAVRDRADLLEEAFVKSNRLALMWGVPFGLALALYAPDLVEFGIGSKWEPAVTLLQVMGVLAALHHVGFNWWAFYAARGETRPTAVAGVLTLIAFCAVALPLLAAEGLDGFAVGMAATTAVSLACRAWYLTRLFDGFRMLAHASRAIAPSVPAVGVALLLHALPGDRTLGRALAELAAYLVVTAAATLALERPLLREVAGYLRGPRHAREVPA